MGPFLRWVITKSLSHFAVHELSAFTDGSYSETEGGAATPVYIQRLQVRYRVIRSGLQQDYFENVLHFVNSGGELPGAAATDTQKTAVETAFDNLFGTYSSKVGSEVALQEYRWYHMGFGDPLSGPPTRVTTKSSPLAGSRAGAIPQACTNLTLRTALRKHWGRIALPAVDMTTGGFNSNSFIDDVANGGKAFANACDAADMQWGVYSPSSSSFFSLMAVESDNVVDIQRRRRPKNSTYRNIITS